MLNTLLIYIRKFLRFTKINKLLVIILYLFRDKDYYENSFRDKMLENIKKDDCLWDVGANVGLYTKLFSSCLNNNSTIYAFEPSKENLVRLNSNLKEYKNVKIVPFGLNKKNEKVQMMQSADEFGASSQIITNDLNYIDDSKLFTINTYSGDYLVKEKNFIPPNFIKLDVEGYEYDVITGLINQLKSKDLRVICIELHFELVAKRGFADHPNLIIKLLKKNNFKVSWTDYSHIIATKI